MSTPERTQLSQALARITSGAFILTLRDGEAGPRAVVLSFVQQVSLAPPRIVVSIHKERSIIPALERTGTFVLNICADGEQALLQRLTDGAEEPGRVLAGQPTRSVAEGLVLESASAYLTCRVAQRVDIGDHWLYIAEVTDGAPLADRPPLVHVRRSGLKY